MTNLLDERINLQMDWTYGYKVARTLLHRPPIPSSNWFAGAPRV